MSSVYGGPDSYLIPVGVQDPTPQAGFEALLDLRPGDQVDCKVGPGMRRTAGSSGELRNCYVGVRVAEPIRAGQWVERTPDGLRVAACGDCAAPAGQPHVDGCDVARCTACGFQRVACEHGGGDVGWGQVWAGEWPGDAECREWGWLLPDGRADLNRLAEHAAGLRAPVLRWSGTRWVTP